MLEAPRIARTVGAGVILVCATLSAQTYSIQTVAGPIAGPLTVINAPAGVAADSKGFLYIAVSGSHVILRRGPEGFLSSFAGDGVDAYRGDGGSAATASFGSPSALAVDSSDNIYVADTKYHTVRMISAATGLISTIAGVGRAGSSSPNPAGNVASSTPLNTPSAIAYGVGRLYITDTLNNALRFVDLQTGSMYTPLGGDGVCGSITNTGNPRRLCGPSGVAADSLGNVYIADTRNCQIVLLDSANRPSTFAGSPSSPGPFIPIVPCGSGTGDNTNAVGAQVVLPSAMALDLAGNLIFSESTNHRVRLIDPGTHIVRTIAGQEGLAGFSGDGGPATAARLSSPQGIAAGPLNNLFVADNGNNRVRMLATSCVLDLLYPTEPQTAPDWTIQVKAPDGCRWAVSSNTPWVNTPRPSSGVGNGSVTFRLEGNLSSDPRSGQVSISGTIATVRQAGNPTCIGTVSPASFLGPVGLMIGSFQLTIKSFCTWTATSNASWAAVNPKSGTGNTQISFNSDFTTANPSIPRVAQIRVAGTTFTILQSPLKLGQVRTTGDAPQGCTVPAAKTQFNSRDAAAYVWFQVDNAVVGDQPSIEWLDPSGTSYRSEVLQKAAAARACWAPALPIANTPAAGLAGAWTAIGRWNGIEIFRTTVNLTVIPQLNTQPVVSLASLAPGSAVSAGSMVRVTGIGLAAQAARVFSGSPRLTFALGGVGAQVAGIQANLLEVAPDHVDLQIPWGVQDDMPELVLTGPNYRLTTKFALAASSPAVFQVADAGALRAAVYRPATAATGSRYDLVNGANPLRPGDPFRVRVTGLGPVSHPPFNGDLGVPDSQSIDPVGVELGGVKCEVQSAALESSGTAENVGVETITAVVPAATPFGSAVPLVVRAGTRQSETVMVPVGGQPISASIQLRQPETLSSPPLAPLVLPASGLIPGAPAAVRFFTPDGSYSEVVGGFEVTSDSLETVVPLFAAGQDQLGSGTVSVEILQVINGRTVRSNAIEGFQIQDLPQSTLPAGSVVVAMLRAQAETYQASEGALGYMERLTKGRRGTSGARATMQNGAAVALRTAGALADIVADPTRSIPFADVGNGVVVSLDAETLGVADRILTAIIRDGFPAPAETPVAPALRQTAGTGLFFRAAATPRADSTVLPECEIPDPTEQELAALVNGTRSPLNFVQQYKACLENLNRLSAIDDFSAWLDRRMKRADRRFKILASLGYPAVLPELTGPNLPAPKVGLAKFLTKVISLPTAANLAGQTFAVIMTGISTWGDDSPQARKLRADVSRRFESSLWEFGKDKFFDAMGKFIGERTFGQPPLPGSELLGGNVQAWLEGADVINEENARVAETENKPDPKGAAGSNVEDVPSYPPTNTIDGVVKDNGGNPQEGSSIALCPPLPGQSNPPLSQSPTYSDGSYVLVMPVNFDEPDKVCKVVLKTPGQPDDTVVTDISQPPNRIDFPESSAPKDELLYGQAVGTGNVPGCGPVGDIGLTKMRLLLPNTSLYDLARNGGSVSGITTYTGVSAGFQPGNCKAEYFSETKYDVPVTVEVAAGGAGVLRITGDRDYQVQVTSSGITGSVTVSTCGTAGVNCKFNMELERFK